MSVPIPTWEEIDEKLHTLGGNEMDPIEEFIHCQEPAGEEANKEFKEKLQAMLDFVAKNYS